MNNELNKLNERIDLDMPKITVIDAPCGKGKTQYSIQFINESSLDSRFIYITPFLDEVERIKTSCKNRTMYEPNVKQGKGQKLESLKLLMSEGKNIVTTHALFHNIDNELISLIHSGGYTLILDEVMNMIEIKQISYDDWLGLLAYDRFKVEEDSKITWLDDEYSGDFEWMKQLAKSDNLYVHKRNSIEDGKVQLLIWTFPIISFTCFEEVYILTYMFDNQLQRYYFDTYNLKYTKKSVDKNSNNEYILTDYNAAEELEYRKKFIDLINIYEGKLNNIGDDNFALSSTWLKNHTKELKLLKNNAENYFAHIIEYPSKLNMWTTIKGSESISKNQTDDKVKKSLSGKGYTRGFVSCNTRATNDYIEKTACAYLLNRFINPMELAFFQEKEIEINQNAWSASELIQWLFRSAVRNGQPINVYIPANRMRGLLIDWLYGKI